MKNKMSILILLVLVVNMFIFTACEKPSRLMPNFNCSETDSAKDKGHVGTTFGYYEKDKMNGEFTDECSDGDTLIEYYCSDNEDGNRVVKSEKILCQRGCIEGICYS